MSASARSVFTPVFRAGATVITNADTTINDSNAVGGSGRCRRSGWSAAMVDLENAAPAQNGQGITICQVVGLVTRGIETVRIAAQPVHGTHGRRGQQRQFIPTL